MLTRLPLSLMVELAVDCSTKYSVPRALRNSGDGFSSATGPDLARPGVRYAGLDEAQHLGTAETRRYPLPCLAHRGLSLGRVPGLGQVRRQLGDVLADHEGRLPGLDPPALGQTAD